MAGTSVVRRNISRRKAKKTFLFAVIEIAVRSTDVRSCGMIFDFPPLQRRPVDIDNH